MYSRSYYPEPQERLPIPENYDGTAFQERENDDEPYAEKAEESTQTFAGGRDQGTGGILSSFARLPILSGLFVNGCTEGGGSFLPPKIGTEEILIIATAAFLLFSKSGDKECAVILLLLLFIN